jgi:Holliday junction resolvase RusA-like endonuclease
MKITILGEPLAKQSAKFRRRGKFVQSYQPEKVVNNERNIRYQVIEQLPKGFIPFQNPIVVKKLHYVFPLLKNMRKKDLKAIHSGEFVYKFTKPDLTDNLNKSLFDAMEGIVFVNDSLIVSMDNVKKYYGLQPRIELEIEELEEL